MRTMVLLAGPPNDIRSINGWDVSTRPFEDFHPLFVCSEYTGSVMGFSTPGSLPPLGNAVLGHFGTARELNDELANELTSMLDSALAENAEARNPDLSARWSDATMLTSDTLTDWIRTNKGKWVAQVWVE